MGLRGWWCAPAAAALLAAGTLSAQEAEARSAVRIEAAAEAGSIRFERASSGELRIDGCADAARPEVVERHNLPARVEPGATYRGARIEVRVEVPLRLDGDPRLADELAGVVARALCPPPDEETEAQEDG